MYIADYPPFAGLIRNFFEAKILNISNTWKCCVVVLPKRIARRYTVKYLLKKLFITALALGIFQS